NLSSASATARSRDQHHKSHPRAASQSAATRPIIASAPNNTAKETFLNYFFGSQGPATGPSAAIPSSIRFEGPVVTDILGNEPLPEQDMGKVVALDMKSLSKHIETDLVPKAIMHLLVNNTSQQVQNRLVSSLYKPDMFMELLHEDETLVAERERVKALLDAYKEAFKTLSE
ncbi:15281_t:CDS:2, partial [Acaulospora colombiana]